MENKNYAMMSAQTFYEKTLISQRRMVNVEIRNAMEHGNYTVKLPTQLYVKISDELNVLGWEEYIEVKVEDTDDGVSCIYPACACKGCDCPAITGEHEFISAQEFYEATLKNQRRDLWVAMEYSKANGLSEVKLPYKAYPIIIGEMDQNDWEHAIWYDNIKTKEECSMFYPSCGFEEEE